MRCFRFIVTSLSEPSKRSTAHLWINERDLNKAEAGARAHLRKLGWQVDAIELSMMPSRKELANLDATQASAYRRALAEGIYVYF